MEDIVEEEQAQHTYVTADREKRLNVEDEGEGYIASEKVKEKETMKMRTKVTVKIKRKVAVKMRRKVAVKR